MPPLSARPFCAPVFFCALISWRGACGRWRALHFESRAPASRYRHLPRPCALPRPPHSQPARTRGTGHVSPRRGHAHALPGILVSRRGRAHTRVLSSAVLTATRFFLLELPSKSHTNRTHTRLPAHRFLLVRRPGESLRPKLSHHCAPRARVETRAVPFWKLERIPSVAPPSLGEAQSGTSSGFPVVALELGTVVKNPAWYGQELAPGNRHCHLAVRPGLGRGCLAPPDPWRDWHPETD